MVENEQIKLTANWLNGVSIAMVAVGGLAPPLSGTYAQAPADWSRTVLVSVLCFCLSAGLHYAARRTLGKLKP